MDGSFRIFLQASWLGLLLCLTGDEMEESRLFFGCAIDGWKILSEGSFRGALLALSLLLDIRDQEV